VSAEDLKTHLAAGFPRWWLPHVIEFVTDIPRTSAGKVQKSALREKFSNWTGESFP
jgi:fatty-acyl-CoA synthase